MTNDGIYFSCVINLLCLSSQRQKSVAEGVSTNSFVTRGWKNLQTLGQFVILNSTQMLQVDHGRILLVGFTIKQVLLRLRKEVQPGRNDKFYACARAFYSGSFANI